MILGATLARAFHEFIEFIKRTHHIAVDPALLELPVELCEVVDVLFRTNPLGLCARRGDARNAQILFDLAQPTLGNSFRDGVILARFLIKKPLLIKAVLNKCHQCT